MGRYKGLGMPRAKKKKPPPAHSPPPDPSAAPETPLPAPSPLKPTKVVAGESPSKTVLLQAEQAARRAAATKGKEARALVLKYQKEYEVAGRVFDARMKRIELEATSTKRKKNISPYTALDRMTTAASELSEARYRRLLALFLSSDTECEILHANLAAKDAKIARLRRQLKVARIARWRRRGWSTTRVRFSLCT